MPLDQRFTVSSLSKGLSTKIFRRHPDAYKIIDAAVSTQRYYEKWLEEVSNEIRNGRFTFKCLIDYVHPRTNKTTYSVKKNDGFSEELVINRINYVLRRIFKINFTDRHKATSQVNTILAGDFEGCVIKLDIEEFYESIDNKALENKLLEDRLISEEVKGLIKRFFKYYRNATAGKGNSKNKGIPRGLSVSATCSEYVMRDFDKKVRQLDGVYFYTRYVDDILILSTSDHTALLSKVNSILKTGLTKGLEFKKEKEKILQIKTGGKDCWKSAKCLSTGYSSDDTSFEYLGYNFKINPIENLRKKIPKDKENQCSDIKGCHLRGRKQNKKTKKLKADLTVSISEKKINKLKARVGICFQSYKKNADITLLKNRLKVLSGAYPLDRSKQLLADDVSELKGGLCYTYPLVNDLGGLFSIDRQINRECSLKRIPASSLSLSFHKNFLNKEFYDFKISEIREIRKAWKYAEVAPKKA